MAQGNRMSGTDGLFVIWREPTEDGHRHVVGRLWLHSGRYRFGWAADLAEAKARGFRPMVEFPDESVEYESGYLLHALKRLGRAVRPWRQGAPIAVRNDISLYRMVVVRSGGPRAP